MSFLLSILTSIGRLLGVILYKLAELPVVGFVPRLLYLRMKLVTRIGTKVGRHAVIMPSENSRLATIIIGMMSSVAISAYLLKFVRKGPYR